MNISDAAGRIKNLRARIEFHGDVPKQAANCNVIFTLTEGIDDFMRAMGIASVAGDLFDSDGMVRTGATEFGIKNPMQDVTLILKPSKGRGSSSIRGDLKSVVITPKVGNLLEVAAKVAGEITESNFCYLWRLWGDGDCLVTLTENQLRHDLSPNDQRTAQVVGIS